MPAGEIWLAGQPETGSVPTCPRAPGLTTVVLAGLAAVQRAAAAVQHHASHVVHLQA